MRRINLFKKFARFLRRLNMRRERVLVVPCDQLFLSGAYLNLAVTMALPPSSPIASRLLIMASASGPKDGGEAGPGGGKRTWLWSHSYWKVILGKAISSYSARHGRSTVFQAARLFGQSTWA